MRCWRRPRGSASASGFASHEGGKPRTGGRDELVLAGLPRRPYGRQNAAAGARDLFIADAGEALLEFACAIAAIDEMCMAIDQARRDPAAVAIDPFLRVERRRGVSRSSRVNDAAPSGSDDAVLDNAESRTR